MYIRIIQDQTIYPYSLEQLRRDFPGRSFASNPINRDWDQLQVYPVESILPPEYDPVTETLIEIEPIKENGNYIQQFSKIKLDLNKAENNVRKQRNKLLAESDWTQLPDSPVVDKTAWANYRNELRNISNQSGFPYQVIWPTKPGD